MRTIIVDINLRSRPKLRTPSKGSTGDLTNESQKPLTDIDFIIKRYGGNLAELQAWRGKLKYGDAASIPVDLVDAFNIMKDAHDKFNKLDNNPFGSFDEAMSAIADGTFMDKFSKPEKTSEKTSEKTPEKTAEEILENTLDNTVNNTVNKE